MFEQLNHDSITATALVDVGPIRAAVEVYPLARKPLLRLIALCESARRLFDNQERFAMYRECWANDPEVKSTFTKLVRDYAADLVRAEGYTFDAAYFDTVPPAPTKEERLETLNKERDEVLSKLKALSAEIKALSKVDKPRNDKVTGAREYTRYRRELRRIDAS